MTEYISATPEPAKQAKARPSAVWFAVGGLLLVVGVVAGIVLFYRIFDSGFLTVEATIPADGAAHQVSVDNDSERFLWEPQYGSSECVVVDEETGGAITLHPVSGDFIRSYNADSWQAVATFDPGSGRLSVTCAATAGAAQIGPALIVEDFVVAIILAIVVPLLLIGLGIAVVIAVSIMFATRPRRTA
jgi:hypothetical protein